MNEESRLFNIFARMLLGVLVCIAAGVYGYYSSDNNWMIISSAFAVFVVGFGLFQYISLISSVYTGL